MCTFDFWDLSGLDFFVVHASLLSLSTMHKLSPNAGPWSLKHFTVKLDIISKIQRTMKNSKT